jgi:hypothetical protein
LRRAPAAADTPRGCHDDEWDFGSTVWRAFGLLAVGVFLSVLELFIVSIAFPAIQAGLGAIRMRFR